MNLVSKRNFVLIMAIFLLFVTVASASAMDAEVITSDEGNITVDTLSSVDDVSVSQEIEEVSDDDSIIDSTNAEEKLSAVEEESDVLGASTNDISVYEPDKDYSENHVYDITPHGEALEFLSHIREISPGYRHIHHEIDVFWTSVENGTMWVVYYQHKDKTKTINAHIILPDGRTIYGTQYLPDLVDPVNGITYHYIDVVRFDNIPSTASKAQLYTNRNGGEPFTINEFYILNSTIINLTVNDKLEDTIWLGEDAILEALVYVLNNGQRTPATEGTVHYNVTDVNGTQIINPIGTSAPGGNISFTPTAIGDYIFKAWFEDHMGNQDFESHSNTVILHVVAPPTADVSIEKTVSNATPYVGEEVTFTITVVNNGPDDATGVTVTDKLPDGLIYVSDDSNGDYDPDTGVWNIGDLANQSKATLNIVALVNTTFANNTAKVSIKENDTNSSNDEDFAIVEATYSVILNITKTANVNEILVGDQVEFTITVVNIGKSNATDVNITDVLDAAFEYVSSTPSATRDGQKITWNIGKLTPNDPQTFKVIVIVKNEGTYNNTAAVISKENETETNDTTNITAHTVILNITKTANASNILVGDQVEFTITVVNIGTGNATDVNITDVLDAAFTYESSTPSATVDGQKITWNIGKLTPNDPKTFKVIVTVTKEGTYNNTAAVISKENKTEVNDTTNITAGTVILKITKTGNVSDVYVGDLVKFTITVENIGTSNATNVVLRDAIDINIFKYFDSDADDVEEDLVMWNRDLASGESFTGWLTLMVLANGTNINTAVVNCDENKNEVNSSFEVTASKLHVTIVVGNYTTTPGKTITVEITVTDELGRNVTCGLNVTVTGPESTDSLPPHEGILAAIAGNQLGAGTIEVLIDNGKGSFNYTVPEDAVLGTSYVVTATMEGYPEYYDAEGTGYIDVIQYKTSITVSNATKYPGDEVEVTFTVDTEDNVPFNGDINVTLPDGKTTLVKITDGKGKYTWTVPEDAQKGDEFVFKASFDGNGTYLPSSGTGTVKVIKLKTTTTVSDATGKPGETVTLTVKVTTEDGTPFNGDVVVTLPNGKNITVTIKNGVGTFDWTIPKDATDGSVYKFIAYCNGDLIYMESSGTGFVNVVSEGNNTPTNNETVPPVKTMLNTGNPLAVLVAAMIFLGLGIKRREDE